jgi:hypothetical protein
MAERADQIARRENELREVVTAFLATVERGEKVRADAEVKAAALRAQADRDAAGHDEQAATEVRRMLELGESREAVAALTDWPGVRIREIQRSDVAEREK